LIQLRKSQVTGPSPAQTRSIQPVIFTRPKDNKHLCLRAETSWNMDALRNKIWLLRRENAFKQYYVPGALLDSTMTAQEIEDALLKFPNYEHNSRELAEAVIYRGKRTFSVLILNDLARFLPQFVESDHLDTKLPFSEDTLVREIRLSQAEAQRFQRGQWELIAPVFRRGTINNRFDRDRILPFQKNEELGHGSFGLVFRVTLDREHQATGNSFHEQVIVSDCWFWW
jgi:hypothetical protein